MALLHICVAILLSMTSTMSNPVNSHDEHIGNNGLYEDTSVDGNNGDHLGASSDNYNGLDHHDGSGDHNSDINSNTNVGEHSVPISHDFALSIGDNSHSDAATQSGSGDSSHPDNAAQSSSGDSSHPDNAAQSSSGDSSHSDNAAQSGSGDSSHPDDTAQSSSGDSSHPDNDAQSSSGDRSHPDNAAQSGSGDSSHPDNAAHPGSGDSSHPDNAAQSGSGDSSHHGDVGKSSTLNSHACDNDYLTLPPCEPGKVVKIVSANYGRTSESVDCGGVNTFTNNCRTEKAKKLVELCCNNRDSCHVRTDMHVYGGVDPCSGVSKYAEANYTCKADPKSNITPGVTTSSFACEDDEIQLRCPHDYVIKVTDANFSPIDDSVNIPEMCGNFSKDVTELVSKRCNSKGRCHNMAMDFYTGEPCLTVYKKLQVNYTCIVPGPTSPDHNSQGQKLPGYKSPWIKSPGQMNPIYKIFTDLEKKLMEKVSSLVYKSYEELKQYLNLTSDVLK